jgi:hypothetical protein
MKLAINRSVSSCHIKRKKEDKNKNKTKTLIEKIINFEKNVILLRFDNYCKID